MLTRVCRQISHYCRLGIGYKQAIYQSPGISRSISPIYMRDLDSGFRRKDETRLLTTPPRAVTFGCMKQWWGSGGGFETRPYEKRGMRNGGISLAGEAAHGIPGRKHDGFQVEGPLQVLRQVALRG